MVELAAKSFLRVAQPTVTAGVPELGQRGRFG